MTDLKINGRPIRTKDQQISLLDVSKAIGYSSRALHRFMPASQVNRTLIAGYRQSTAGPKAVVSAIKNSSYSEPEYLDAVKEAYPQAFVDTQPVEQPVSVATAPNALNALQLTFQDAEVRIVCEDPVTVVLSDVAKALGYRDGRTIARSIKDKYRVTHKVCDTSGREQEMLCVTRPGLSQALTALRPQDPGKKEKVEAFQDWLYEEVLESIYDTGSYVLGQSEEQASHQDQPSLNSIIATAQQQISTNQKQLAGVLDLAERIQTQKEIEYDDRQAYLEQGNVEDATYADYDYAHLIDKPSELKTKFVDRVQREGGDGGQAAIYADVYDQLDAQYGVDAARIQTEGGYESKIQALLDVHSEEEPVLLWAINLL